MRRSLRNLAKGTAGLLGLMVPAHSAPSAASQLGKLDTGPLTSEEEVLLNQLRMLKAQQPKFSQHNPFNRNRRFPRGDRNYDIEGRFIGPVWRGDEPTYTAAAYDGRRGFQSGGSFSTLKKTQKRLRLAAGVG